MPEQEAAPAALADALAACAGRDAVPGAVVAVQVGDQPPEVATFGVTNADHPAPVEAGTLFQVASISKTFTSAAVLLLVEDGRVALDDPVGRQLPGFAAATGLDAEAITVEHLLSHQAGFDGDHLFVTGRQDLAALADARRLFPPGTGFSYSNAGFSVAGELVATLEGEPFDVVVRRRLLEPLGIGAAGFRADEVITRSVAAPHWVYEGTPHVIRGGGWQPRWEIGPIDWPAAGLVASAEQLLVWGRAQLTGRTPDGARLLAEESLARLHTPVVDGEPLDRVALDWYVREVDGATTWGHGGVAPGCISDLLVVPEHDAVVVCLTNATNGAATNHEVRRWVLQHRLGLHERDPAPDPEVTLDPGAVSGRYLHSFCELTVGAGDGPGEVHIEPSARTDDPGWQPPLDPAVTVRATSATDAVDVEPGLGPPRTVRFGFGADGQAEWLQWGGRFAPRLPLP